MCWADHPSLPWPSTGGSARDREWKEIVLKARGPCGCLPSNLRANLRLPSRDPAATNVHPRPSICLLLLCFSYWSSVSWLWWRSKCYYDPRTEWRSHSRLKPFGVNSGGWWCVVVFVGAELHQLIEPWWSLQMCVLIRLYFATASQRFCLFTSDDRPAT